MNRHMHLGLAAIIAGALLWNPKVTTAADDYTPFAGEKTAWHDGFDRYDFVMDSAYLNLKSFKVPTGENFGIGDPAKGQRRCIVVVPKQAAPGRPWICGSIDPLLGRFALPIENSYQQWGGRISVMMKEAQGHYPTAPHDPKPVVDFITAQTH